MTTPRTEHLPHLEVPDLIPADPLLALLKQSAEGDEAAFSAVYDATCARAYGLGLRLLHDPVEASECVQESYLHLWRHAASFQPCVGSPISWVLMTVHRCVVRRARSMTAPLGPDGPGVQMADGPALALVDHPPIERQAVELAYFGGCTHTEVEQLADLPAGTARLRMRDGLLELRDHPVSR